MRILLLSLILLGLTVPGQSFAESKVNVNINVGLPAPLLPPPPMVPAAIGAKVFFEAPPLFLAPPTLGFYVGVDMPYDLMLVSGQYYLFQGNRWYRASHYNGPWVVTRYEQLPTPVRQYKLEKIRYYRDNEYRSYHDNREHYRGKHYRPDKAEREHWKEEKRHQKEERKHHKKKHGRDDD